jgi:hypothetical protein
MRTTRPRGVLKPAQPLLSGPCAQHAHSWSGVGTVLDQPRLAFYLPHVARRGSLRRELNHDIDPTTRTVIDRNAL